MAPIEIVVDLLDVPVGRHKKSGRGLLYQTSHRSDQLSMQKTYLSNLNTKAEHIILFVLTKKNMNLAEKDSIS